MLAESGHIWEVSIRRGYRVLGYFTYVPILNKYDILVIYSTLWLQVVAVCYNEAYQCNTTRIESCVRS